MPDLSKIDIQDIMDSLSDGVYVCDLNRKIVHWSKSAERITGWRADEVLGICCFEDVLCHIDKDGHKLCGEEYCPLHRSMITGTRNKGSLLVFAQSKGGQRIPMLVDVSPLYDDDGEIIGGVETFRDATSTINDLERARAIQQIALENDLPEDPRIHFTTHYTPNAIVGGDYYAIEKLGDDQYGLMLADVMGHGTAAALYTMHLSALWNRYHDLLLNPVDFISKLNNELVEIVKTDESFATAVCGVVDLAKGEFRFSGAGGPQVLLMHPDGTHQCLESSGLPLAVMEDAEYEQSTAIITPGDRLLLFSDGALEVDNAAGGMLGMEGFIEILRNQNYPQSDIRMAALEKDLLKYSNAIRLEDDLTLLEVCLG